MSGAYLPERYWADMHRFADDERAVGYRDLARSINRARYSVERRSVRRALAAAAVGHPERVLDIGSGTGIWIDFWRRQGATEITGLDLAELPVARLRGRYPEHTFIRSDVCEPSTPLPGDMDVVSAMSVLLHITDEERFERALQNLLQCVRPGGVLVLVEPAIVHRWWGPPFGPQSNSRARPLSSYTRVLAAAGFEIEAVRPTSCILANVIDTRKRLTFMALDGYWRLLGRVVGRREWVGRAVAPILQAIDLLVTTIAPSGPSVKVIVARRGACANGSCES